MSDVGEPLQSSASGHTPVPGRPKRNLQFAGAVGAGVAMVGYLVAVHLATTHAGYPLLGLALALVPLLSLGVVRLVRTRRFTLGLFLSILLVGSIVAMVALAAMRGALGQSAVRIYFIQHVGVNLFLCWFFGHTLAGAGDAAPEPLVTRFARMTHGAEMPQRLVAYTRHATIAWTIFFAVMALISVGLYALAPVAAWSTFANLLNLPLLALMFIGEYLVRMHCVGDVLAQTGSRRGPGALFDSVRDSVRAFRDFRINARR